MCQRIDKEHTPEEPVTIFKYRGFEIPVYLDEPGQQFYCVFDGEEIGFGSYNPEYEGDLKYLIDTKLDIIHRFDEPYWGARLEWFDNGGFRDIRLLYRLRVIKVFLISENFKLDDMKETLMKESEEILNKLVKLN